MPSPLYRRLTPADYPRIAAYQAQHYTSADMAQALGCSLAQVQRALRHLGLNTRGKYSRKKPSLVCISWEQYQLVKWHKKGTFHSRDLAERLGSSNWLFLERQLRGVAEMGAQRIAALTQLVKELDPEAEAELSTPSPI